MRGLRRPHHTSAFTLLPRTGGLWRMEAHVRQLFAAISLQGTPLQTLATVAPASAVQVLSGAAAANVLDHVIPHKGDWIDGMAPRARVVGL
jgi:hypothetical protein